MAINIPFNFQPVSVSVQTSSYTIPANNYAFITANVRNGGSFTIDSNTVLQSSLAVDGAVAAVSETIDDTPGYTVPAGYRFEGFYTPTTGTGNLIVDGNTVYSSVSNTVELKVGPGDQVRTNSSAITGIIWGFALRENEPESNVTASFWVPSGTIINGSGTWRATVSLYNEIS